MGKDHELLEAARTGNIGIVEKLIFPKSKSSHFAATLGIRVGANVNCQDQNGYSPLHHASLNGHCAIVRILLDVGASVNVPDNKGSCPLHLAAWNGKTEIVRILLTSGPNFASVNEQNGDKETALSCSAQHGHVDAVKILLDNHADPHVRNIRDESALDLASQYGRLEVVRVLLTHHPKLLARSPERFTPLHLASRNGHRGVVELLLVHGADINKVGANGTALHEAALFGKYDVVRLLLKRGAETGSKDSSGRTALELVSQLDTQISRDIAKLIIDITAASKFDEPTNVFVTGAKVSRNLSRSFGEADLVSRDSPRGRPSTATSFRYSRSSQLSPDESRSPTSHRLKTSALRRTSSARSARSLPKLASTSSYHGNRSLHSFSSHRKRSDAQLVQDWSIRQHHPSIDMFPVTPTRASHTNRRTSASEPSSPQLGAGFVSPVNPNGSPGPVFRDTPFRPEDDSVFFPGTPTSARPSFGTFLPFQSNTPSEFRAVVPLKPPAEMADQVPPIKSSPLSIIISQPSMDKDIVTSRGEDPGIPPPLPKKTVVLSESRTSSVYMISPDVDIPLGITSVSEIAVTSRGSSGDLSPHSSQDMPLSPLSEKISTSSEVSPSGRSPNAPIKPQRHKLPSNPPPLPPKPRHMMQGSKKTRPPSPSNPPPDDDDDTSESASDAEDRYFSKEENPKQPAKPSTVKESGPLSFLPSSDSRGLPSFAESPFSVDANKNRNYKKKPTQEDNFEKVRPSPASYVRHEQSKNVLSDKPEAVTLQANVCKLKTVPSQSNVRSPVPTASNTSAATSLNLEGDVYGSEALKRESLGRGIIAEGGIRKSIPEHSSNTQKDNAAILCNSESTGANLDSIGQGHERCLFDQTTDKCNDFSFNNPLSRRPCNKIQKSSGNSELQGMSNVIQTHGTAGGANERKTSNSRKLKSQSSLDQAKFSPVPPEVQQLSGATQEYGISEAETHSLKHVQPSSPHHVELTAKIVPILKLASKKPAAQELPNNPSLNRGGLSQQVKRLPHQAYIPVQSPNNSKPSRIANATPTQEGAKKFPGSSVVDAGEIAVKFSILSSNGVVTENDAGSFLSLSPVEGNSKLQTTSQNVAATPHGTHRAPESTKTDGPNFIPLFSEGSNKPQTVPRTVLAASQGATDFAPFSPLEGGSKPHTVPLNVVVTHDSAEKAPHIAKTEAENCFERGASGTSLSTSRPTLSPPSPNTAMLQVSSALQKAMTPARPLTDRPAHLPLRTLSSPSNNTGLSSLILTQKSLKEHKRPEVPKKRFSLGDRTKVKNCDFAENMRSNILISPVASKPAKTMQNLGTKTSEISPEIPLKSLKNLPTERVKRTSHAALSTANLAVSVRRKSDSSSFMKADCDAPIKSKKPVSFALSSKDTRDGTLFVKKTQTSVPSHSEQHKPHFLRTQSGPHYRATEVKRARICSTRSITEMPDSQTYGEYDNLANLEATRPKRSASLGSQVAPLLSTKPMQMQTEIQNVSLVRKVTDAHTQTYPPLVSPRRKPFLKSKSIEIVHHDEPNTVTEHTMNPMGLKSPIAPAKSPQTFKTPVPKIKSALVKTSLTSAQARKPQRPKKPIKPAHLLRHKARASQDVARRISPVLKKDGFSYPASSVEGITGLTGKSATSHLSLATSDEWNDAISDRTEDLSFPQEFRKFRGLIRGSSLSYRSRFCGSGGPDYDSDEFEYNYRFDSKAAFSRVNESLQPDSEIDRPRIQKVETKQSGDVTGLSRTRPTHFNDVTHFPLRTVLMEVDPVSPHDTNFVEPTKAELLHHKPYTVTSQDLEVQSWDSAYDNTNFNNNSNNMSEATRLQSETSPSPFTKSGRIETVGVVPGPMPDFGTIVDTVTAVRKKSSPHGSTSGFSSSSSSQSSTLAKQEVKSTINESDEWTQIANVMKSVGSSLNKGSVYAQEFEETFWRIMTGSDLPRRVGAWLSDLNLSQYEEVLIGNGFDNVSFLASSILEEQDLIDMNILNVSHQRRLLDSAKNLPKIRPLTIHDDNDSSDDNTAPSSVKEWLTSIALEQHEEIFDTMGFNTLEKVARMKDTEIAGLIPLRGHRKRIRASLGSLTQSRTSKSRSVSQSSSKAGSKLKSSPSLPRSPLLEEANFYKDYSQNVATTSTNSNPNTYGTASSGSSGLTNFSTISDQVVPISISEEPELSSRRLRNSSVTKYNRSRSENIAQQRKGSREKNSDFSKPPQYNSGSLNSRRKSGNLGESNQEDDQLTLAINRLTDGSVKFSSKQQENKENINMSTSESNEIRVPSARRASYLSSNGKLILRPPNEATEDSVHVSSWCHSPEVLIKSCCNYQAYYLGSMLVHEVKGVESTVEACAKMKRSTDSMKKIPTITLSISYRGVKFIDSKSKHEIAEHEIHNISFASQDAEDLSTLAYITRDARTDNHYCHVFRVTTLDVAYEIILTLGQAFEVAYQLILKEKASKEETA